MPPTDPHSEIAQLIARLPQTADVLSLRAAAMAESGDPKAAETVLRTALGRHQSPSLSTTLARVLILQGRHKEAMSEMVSVLRRQPDNPTALTVLAQCLLECGEHDRGRKMIAKARDAGAPAAEVNQLERRYAELTGTAPPPPTTVDTSADPRERRQTLMGRPNVGPSGAPGYTPVSTPSPPTEPAPPPTPRRAPPPPLQSGTFAGLDTYEIDDDEDAYESHLNSSERVRLTDDGPLEPVVDPTVDEVSGPTRRDVHHKLVEAALAGASATDRTSIAPADASPLADPDDMTGHMRLPAGSLESDVGLPAIAETSWDSLPSVENHPEYSPRQGHQPPADLDDLPSWNDEVPPSRTPYIEEDATHPDVSSSRDEVMRDLPTRDSGLRAQNFPNLDPSVLFDDEPADDHRPGAGAPASFQQPNRPTHDSPPVTFGEQQQYQPSQQHQSPHPSPRPDSGSFGSQRPADGDGSRSPHGSGSFGGPQRPTGSGSFGSPQTRPQASGLDAPSQGIPPGFGRNPVPPTDRFGGQDAPAPRREVTALAAHPKPPPGTSNKKWLLAGVGGLLTLLLAAGGVSYYAASSVEAEVRAELANVDEALVPDTYPGFVTAEEGLQDALAVKSFLGDGFDDFAMSSLPVESAALRREASARLALVAALLEYRFESTGKHDAAARIAAAQENAPDHPSTFAARAYAMITAEKPHEAVELLRGASQGVRESREVRVAHAWALLDLQRADAAAQVIAPLRKAEPNNFELYTIASVDAARGDETASKTFAEVFARSENHVDSRIGRSYTLHGDAESRKKAQNVLDTVLVKLKQESSRYQTARATSAYGSLYLASGDEDRAEDRFRDSIRKMPGRSELYMPLLQLYAAEGRVEEISETIEKARSENAYAPRMALFEARTKIYQSAPQKTVEIIEKIGFRDAQTDHLHALALIDLGADKKAVELLDETKSEPNQALFHLARSAEPDALEDARHQADRLKTTTADDATIHWAAGTIALAATDRTADDEKRESLLKVARSDFERAIELRPRWTRGHIGMCKLDARTRDMKDARKACNQARKLTPNYVPALVASARLEVLAGDYDKAQEFADAAKKIRPNDSTVGLLLARIAVERRDVATAEEEINRWISKPVDKFELHLLEGRVEFARKEYTRAAGYLKEAYEMRPNDGEAAVYYAHTLTRLEQHGPASDILLANLSEPTWGGYAWAVLGEARRAQRKLRDARENFSKARRIFKKTEVPSKYWSYLYAEWALAERARYRKWRHPRVLAKLKEGREKGDRLDPEINLMWSRYHLEKRRPDEDDAIGYLERVIETAPYHCEAFEALMSLYEKKDRDEAVKELEAKRTDNCSKKESP